MTDQSKNDNNCPFWDKFGKRDCRLVESGLFIPTHEHILRYCESDMYVNCYHYVGRYESNEKITQRWESQTMPNRRQYIRIPTSQPLSVSRYSMARDVDEDVIDDQALVMDLSLGGMRIETSGDIHENQIISLSFDEKFQPPNFKGKAEIRWINKSNSQPSTPINAGLAFVDDETKNTVRNHLLNMGEKLLHFG